jgi:hypothetical protein
LEASNQHLQSDLGHILFKEKEWKGVKQELLSEISDLKDSKENMFERIKDLNEHNQKL